MSINKIFREPDTTVLIDSPDANTTYIGLAKVGASTETSETIWQIIKLSRNGTITTINYADGDLRFDNIWDNRLSLTYV